MKTLVSPNPFKARNYGELKKITDRVFIFRNITNSSFVVGDRSVCVIDTQVNLPLAQILLKQIRSVTDKPIEYAINTHYHWDHTNGNALFKKEGATILSSKLTKEFMTTRHDRQKAFLQGRGFELGNDPLLADVTFEGRYAIDLGNMPLELFFAGKAETDDATAVFVPREGVLMAGDTIMTGSFPIFGQPVWDEGLEGEGQWSHTIHKLLKKKPQHVIPGHGPMAQDEDIRSFIRIQEYFVEKVKALLKDGVALPQILQKIESELPESLRKIPLVWGTPCYAILRVYRSLTQSPKDPVPGWQRLKPSAIPEPVTPLRLSREETFQDFLQMAEEAEEGGDNGLRLAVLKKAIEAFSEIADAYSAYADALIQVSRREASVLEKGDFFSAAKVSWQRALEINPRHIPSLVGQGRYLTMMAYRGGDDPKEGMRLLNEVISLEAQGLERAEAEFYLGMGFRRLGDEAKARKQFEKALSFDPSFGPAHSALA